MYRKPPITGWEGVDNSSGSLLLKPSSFRTGLNMLINKGRLIPFPKLADFPEIPDNDKVVIGLRTFQDALGNFHTVFLTSTQAYYLNADGTYNPLFDTGGNPFVPTSSSFFSTEVYLNQLFFANGGAPLSYVQGDQNFYKAGNVPGTCFFLGKLAAHLMMVNTIEPTTDQLGSFNFPARVRWSASGNAQEWDPSVDLTAGAVDISDVEDQLTGWATIGVTGFAFRSNGITVFSPTGIGTAPFLIENLSIGPQGVGCNIPYTLVTYGPFCIFVALDDIYIFDGGGPQRIGGKAKKSIFRDIYSATAPVSAYMLGTLLGGTDFLSYWLLCPQGSGDSAFTSAWVFHIDSQSWMNVKLPFGAARVLANIAGLAGLTTFGWGLNWGNLWGEGNI